MRLKLLGIILASVVILIFNPVEVLGQGESGFLEVDNITSTSFEAGNYSAIYTFKFTTSDTGNRDDEGIPPDGGIRILFPPSFDVTNVLLAQSNNSNLTGGFSNVASRVDNIDSKLYSIIELTRDGTGNNVDISTAVSISVGNLTNATSPGNYPIYIFTTTSGWTPIDDNYGWVHRAPYYIAITPAPLSAIKIEDAPDGGGNEVGNLSLTTDDNFTLYAVGYDAYGNFVNNVDVSWTLSGDIGELSPTSGTSSTLTLNKIGNGYVTADDGQNHIDHTGTITVMPGDLNHIKIVEGFSGDGTEFNTRTMTTDQTLTVHAAGYDADSNYIGEENVDWSITGDLIGLLDPSSSSSWTTLNATTPGIGQIFANHTIATDDQTGNITVSVGNLSHIKIVAGLSGDGPEYTTNTIRAGESFSIHAAGYDADGNYRTDESVNWSVINGIGTVFPITNSIFTDFIGTTIGTGLIKADHGIVADDYTDEIMVTAGPVHHITIRTGSNNTGKVMEDSLLFVNQSITLYAAGYDTFNNYVHDVIATWDTTSLSTGQASTLDLPSTLIGKRLIFNPKTSGTHGRFRADSSGVEPDTTGDLTIAEISYIKINRLPGPDGVEVGNLQMSADDSITVYATAYDAVGNYLDTVSVEWLVENLEPSRRDTAASYTFAPTTAGLTGKIIGRHPTAKDDSTGNITVNPGKPYGFFRFIMDSTELTANGTDSMAITTDPIRDRDGNQIAPDELFTLSVSPQNLGITFSPLDIDLKMSGHQIKSDFDGRISFTIRAGTKGGTAFIAANSVNGNAHADTSIIQSSLRILSVEANRYKVSQDQDSIEVRMLVENSSFQAVTSLSPGLKFIGPDGENRNIFYDVFWDTVDVLSIGQQKTLTFKINIANNAPPETVIVDGMISGFAGGTTALQDTAADYIDSLLVQIPPQIEILSVSAIKDTVEKGTNTTVYMTVQNSGEADAVILSDSLSFSLTDPPYTDVTNEYIQVPHPENPNTILAGNPPIQLNYSTTIGANATEGQIRLDGKIFVKDVNSDSTKLVPYSNVTDTWVVKKKGEISVIDFYPSQQAVVQGQTTPWMVIMKIQNNFLIHNMKLDSARMDFIAGTETITSEFTIEKPSLFEEFNRTDTLYADTTETLIFTINKTANNRIGNIKMVGIAYLSDAVHTQIITSGENQIYTKPHTEDLLITDVKLSQFEVTTNQTKDWQIKVAVKNIGDSNLIIDLANDSTYVNVIGGNDFEIIKPTKLELVGDSLLWNGAVDTLLFTVDKTGQTTGTFDIGIQLAYSNITARQDILYVQNTKAHVLVETPPQIRILNAVNVSLNAPYLNTNQNFQIRVDIQNSGDDGVHGVGIALTSDGHSVITSADTFSIAGNDSESVYFDVQADADSSFGEIFMAAVNSAIGDNTTEFDSEIIFSAVDDTALAIIQQPASIELLNVFPSKDNVEALSKNWKIFVIVKRNGAGAVQFDPFHEDNLKFYINGEPQTDYYLTPPSGFKKNGGLLLAGWDSIVDTLEYHIDQAGLLGGQATIQVNLSGKYLNNNNTFIVEGTGTFFVQTTAALRITKTEPVCYHIENSVGFLSTGQEFKVKVAFANFGSEPVDDVWISLTSSDGIRYPPKRLKVDSISAKGEELVEFNLTAQSLEERVEFIARIDSATSRFSDEPASIGVAYDSIAVFQVQTRASLAVEINQADHVMTVGEISYVRFIIKNNGLAKTDNSGRITITLPSNYRIKIGEDLFSGTTLLNFIVDQEDTLKISPPNFVSNNDQITLTISTLPKDLNTGRPAAYSKHFDTITVKTVPSDLNIITEISWPKGATDGIVSTEQLFTVKSILDISDNIDRVEATLILPEEYNFDFGEKATKTVNSDSVIWKLKAPAIKHILKKFIRVDAKGYIGDIEYTESDSISISAVERANLRLLDVGIISPVETDSVLSVNQPLTISATVMNEGTAKAIGTGLLSIDFGSTFITPLTDTFKTFTLDNPVTWEAEAPNFVTGRHSIIVKIESVPQDENTNEDTYIGIGKESISVRTVPAGFVNIDDFRIIAPVGAIDRTLSTNQEFTIQVDVSWNNCAVLPNMSIQLPEGFDTEIEDKNPVGTQTRGTVNWKITAPSLPVANKDIWVDATAKDANSGTDIEFTSDNITVQVVKQAEISLNAWIDSPADAKDNVVSTGQNFTIKANLLKAGTAKIEDYYSVRLKLPPEQGYVTSDTLDQRHSHNETASWTVTAPLNARNAQNFEIELIDPPHDENTNKDIEDSAIIEDEIAIPIRTEVKSVTITVLPRLANISLAKGDTNISVLGLQFDCSGDEVSSKILFNGIRVQLKDKKGSVITDPQNIISKISVVDYLTDFVKYGELTNIPNSDSLYIKFSRTDTLFPGIPNKIAFMVDIAPYASRLDFQVTIDSSSFFDMIDMNSNLRPVFFFNGNNSEELNLSSGYSVIVPQDFEKAFWNYPNPFGSTGRETTTIQYYLDQDCDVNLMIYTLLGELVWSVQYSSTEPQGKKGLHDANTAITWDARNSAGYHVLNGVYIARLSTSYGKSVFTKIAVLK